MRLAGKRVGAAGGGRADAKVAGICSRWFREIRICSAPLCWKPSRAAVPELGLGGGLRGAGKGLDPHLRIR